jgi:hypothetical protein
MKSTIDVYIEVLERQQDEALKAGDTFNARQCNEKLAEAMMAKLMMEPKHEVN